MQVVLKSVGELHSTPVSFVERKRARLIRFKTRLAHSGQREER